MKNFSFLIVFLFCFFESDGQTSFSSKVWAQFYELVQLPSDGQIEGFRRLQKECITNKLTSDSTYTNLLFLFATAQFNNNQIDSATLLLKEALQISKKSTSKNPIPYQSKYYFYLAYYQSQQNKFEEAVGNYHKAYDVGIKAFNKWSIPSLSCQHLSHLYYEVGDYELGLKYASLGVQLDLKNQNIDQLMNNLYEQCLNLYALDNFEDVKPKLDSLISLSETYADDYRKGLFYTLLGKSESSNNSYPKAESAFLKANGFFKASNSKEYIGMNFVALQYLSLLQKDFSKSLKYEKLATVNSEAPFTKSVLLSNKAMYYKGKLDFDNALISLQEALKVLPIGFEPKNLLENPSLEQLNDLTQKEYAFTSLYEKADILSVNKGTWDQALNTYLLLDELIDKMRWQHLDVDTKLYWRDKLNMFYEKAIEVCYKLDKIDKAFYFIEKSRAVLLVDQLNSNAALNRLPISEIQKETALRLQVIRTQNAESDTELSEYLLAKAKLDAYVKYLEKNYPQYYEYKYNNNVPNINVLQQYLGKGNQSLLSYYEGKEAVYILLVTSQKSIMKKVSSGLYLKEKQDIMSLLSNHNWTKPQFELYLNASNVFYQRILYPFEAYLTSRIIISTSGTIIPFAALSTSNKKAEYLVNKYAFSYTYSTRALINNYLIDNSNTKDNYFLGIAPVDFGYKKNLLSLSGSLKAIEENGNLFQSSLLFTKDKAKKSSFEKHWPYAKVVQVISHAYADQINEEPIVYFSDSGLAMNNIHQKAINTQLLILSACRTTVGKDFKGEGVYSLSRGFLETGVASIYSTVWDIIDKDAYDFSYKILQNTKSKMPLDLALQKAQQEWLANVDRSKQLPHAWAGIILLGSSNPLPEEPSSTTWIWIIVSLTIVSLIGLGFWRRNKS